MTQSQAAQGSVGRRAVTIPNPGAVDWEYVLPSGFDWKFVLGTAVLVASATAGNRFLGFHIYDASSGTPGIAGKTNKLQYGVPNAQALTAGNSGNCHYYKGNVLIATGNSALIPVPDLLLPPGWTIGSESFPLAGDSWGYISLLLEAYPPSPNV